MPSVNNTANLQLNQWGPSENITTADLNSNNLKIDTAVGNNKAKLDALPNDAYSKAESNQRFSGSLIGTASGAAITITDVQPDTVARELRVLGVTTETGTGTKSPGNPYVLTGAEPTKVTVNDVEYTVAVDAPLYNLPNGVRDRCDIVSGQIKHEIAKTTLTGLEYLDEFRDLGTVVQCRYNWTAYSGYPEYYSSYSSHFPYLCDYYSDTEHFYIAASGYRIYLYVDKSRLSEASLNGIKQWLADEYAAGRPVEFLWRRATPVTVTISPQTIPLPSSDATLTADAGELEITYSRDINAAFAELRAVILALGGS